MPEYEITLHSATTDGKVLARLDLRIPEAADREEAEMIARGALPGAGWQRWESTWGVVEKEGGRTR